MRSACLFLTTGAADSKWQILDWEIDNWSFAAVSDGMRKAIAGRLCSTELPAKDLTAEGFLFWAINAIQSFWDVTPPIVGRASEENTGNEYLYCGWPMK